MLLQLFLFCSAGVCGALRLTVECCAVVVKSSFLALGPFGLFCQFRLDLKKKWLLFLFQFSRLAALLYCLCRKVYYFCEKWFYQFELRMISVLNK